MREIRISFLAIYNYHYSKKNVCPFFLSAQCLHLFFFSLDCFFNILFLVAHHFLPPARLFCCPDLPIKIISLLLYNVFTSVCIFYNDSPTTQ